MKPYLLGIDIGTSACKVAVFEKSGTVVAAANGDYPVYYPQASVLTARAGQPLPWIRTEMY